MKAIVCTRYGTPEVLQLKELAGEIVSTGEAVIQFKEAHRYVEGGDKAGNVVINIKQGKKKK
jgi:hypothetical protein